MLLKGNFFSLTGSLEKDPTGKKECQKRNWFNHVMLQLVHVESASTMAWRSSPVNSAILALGKLA
jgi:hypothetical protein